MSNEPHKDDSVSTAYRDLAQERTPEHLDRKILAMAAKSAQQPSYSRWIRWARPVAWAATIVLCLAITLELAWQPAVQTPAGSPSTTLPQLQKQEASQQVHGPAPTAARPDADKADAELQQEVAESIANTDAAEKAGVARSASMQAVESVASDAPAAAARSRSIADSPVCPENRRSSAESWFECILELREAGEHSVAEREQQLLIDTFPDFKTP
jgi:type II secretory pathway component PulM